MRLASYQYCTACMACIDACNHDVLSAEVDSEGYFKITVNQNAKCTECGICTRACPVLSPVPVSKPSFPYAAWNTNIAERNHSSSGGAFAALASTIIKNGGVVYGAAIDGFDVKHIRVSEYSELPRIQGSKYHPSDLTGVYSSVRKDLRNGLTVLFSGLGCQVAALKAYLGKSQYERLYTVDTVCGGIATMLPMTQLKDSGKYKGIFSFRDKCNGWKSKGFRYSLKMIDKNGSIKDLGADNIVLATFSSKLFKRPSCLDCKFSGFDRQADCTIGDYWGDIRFPDQHYNGLSIVIIHNDRIKNLMEESSLHCERVKWEDITPLNPNIYSSPYPLFRHLPARKKALKALIAGETQKVLMYCDYKNIGGVMIRVYIKFQSIWNKLKKP